jgi:hypothetical protein
MRTRLTKRTTVVAMFAVALLAFSAAGFAYVTTAGKGQGSAQLANTQDLTVSAVPPASSALYPGASADVAATVNNPNPIPAHVHAFVLDLTEPSGGISNDRSGCSSGGYTGSSSSSVTFNGPFLNGSADFVFPPGDSSLTLHDALSMSASAENACQSATFTVHLQASN